MKGGGGAIDLVMHVNQSDFKSAVAWLDDRFGEEAVQIAASHHAQMVAQEAERPTHPITGTVGHSAGILCVSAATGWAD
jgi:hypothetical protein